MYAKTNSNIFTGLVAVFVPLLLISNISATKGVVLFPDMHINLGFIHMNGLVTDGAFFLFPLAYIIGDIISEVYGFQAARRAIMLSFIITVLASASFALTIALPAAPFWDNQAAMASVLGVVPRILMASLWGYLCGELLNAWVMATLKAKHGERHLALRMVLSTIAGEAADTVMFCSIAAGAIGITRWEDFMAYVLIGLVWKTLMEIGMLPISTRLIALVKQRETTYTMASA